MTITQEVGRLISLVSGDMNILTGEEEKNVRIKSVVKLDADSSTALNQPATLAGVPRRQSPELQYVGPIKHLIATVATLSIIRNIVSIRGAGRERAGETLINSRRGQFYQGTQNCVIARRISICTIMSAMQSLCVQSCA